MKKIIERLLCYFPELYVRLLRLRRSYNAEKAAYLQLVGRNQIVVEVGANIGAFTNLFSMIVGSKGHVYAFEPVPPTFEILSKNTEGNHNITRINQAASDKPGTGEIFMPDTISGWASLKEHSDVWNHSVVNRFEIQATRLDNWLSEEGIDSVDFMKIDIEGGELLALKGMGKFLSEYMPLLHLEVGDRLSASFGYTTNDLIRYLIDNGYDRFYHYDKKFTSIDDIDTFITRKNNGLNLVAASSKQHLVRSVPNTL